MTQGLITIMQGDKVLYKIITGSDGYNALDLLRILRIHEDKLRGQEDDSIEDIWHLANDANFGSAGSLYVVSRDAMWGPDGSCDVPMYRDKFDVPGWNPRWELGTAPYNYTFHLS